MQTQGTIELNVTLRGKTMGDLIAAAQRFATSAGGKGTGKKAAATTDEDEELDLDEETDTDTDDETKTDEDDQMSFDGMDDEGDEDEEETKSAKKTGKAKITDKQVNAAAIAHAKKHGRKVTEKILAKKFKVKSILELKPETYGAVITALKV